MAKEERLMKVLAGLYLSCVEMNLAKEKGALRSDINGAIIRLDFSAHNTHQMGKDLEFLVEKGYVNEVPDGAATRYAITPSGSKVAKSIISVWKAIRGH